MIGAVNTLYFHDGKLVGDNTDWYGVYLALHEVMKLRDKKVLVYGAGGAARSVLYALNKMKADVYLTNRTASKGKVLAKEFHAKFVDPMELPEVDVFINATSVGLPENNFLMVSEEWLKNVYLVFDLVYPNTILERTAKDLELRFISGKRMLLYQGVRQFELFTGFEAPVHQMAKVIDVSV